MQHDDVIWGTVNHHFCSYRVKTVRQRFCRNKYNITGLCEKKSCPLANSRYATIVENDHKLYLFVKTAERAHSPRRLWERIRLSSNYRKALTQIDKQLQYWPKFYIHKAKQRLTKMTQYLIRKRRLQLHSKTRLVGVKKKIERREQGREKKAVHAAKLEASIEKELLERLRTGAYGDIYNFAQEEYEKILDTEMQEEIELEEEEELEEGDEYEAEYEDESDDEILGDIEDGNMGSDAQYDFDDDDSSDDDSLHERDDEDPLDPHELKKHVKDKARRRSQSKDGVSGKKGTKGRRLRKPRGGVRVEVEYEQEADIETQTR